MFLTPWIIPSHRLCHSGVKTLSNTFHFYSPSLSKLSLFFFFYFVKISLLSLQSNVETNAIVQHAKEVLTALFQQLTTTREQYCGSGFLSQALFLYQRPPPLIAALTIYQTLSCCQLCDVFSLLTHVRRVEATSQARIE